MTLTFSRRTLWLGAALLALAPAAAPAQMMMDLSTLDLGIQQMQQNSGLSVSVGQSMMNTDPSWQSSPGRGDPGPRRGRDPKPGEASAPPASPAALTRTTFTPVGPPLVPRQVAAVWPQERRAEAERVYTGWLDDYRAIIRSKRVPQNDVARAASYLLANIAMIEQGGRNLTERQLESVRRQMHDFFAHSPLFARMGDRERQQLFEMYVIMGTVLDDQYQGARERGDTNDIRRLHGINARWSLELLNAPIERVRFTNAGIVIR